MAVKSKKVSISFCELSEGEVERERVLARASPWLPFEEVKARRRSLISSGDKLTLSLSNWGLSLSPSFFVLAMDDAIWPWFVSLMFGHGQMGVSCLLELGSVVWEGEKGIEVYGDKEWTSKAPHPPEKALVIRKRSKRYQMRFGWGFL